MEQLGLRLTKNKGEKNLFNITNTHQRITKWIFNKYPPPYVHVWEDQKTTWQNQHLKKNSTQHNTKDEESRYT